ncbi:MAG: hypothetical protein AAB426_07995, partial [Myxococcota bacterium]
GQVIGAQDINAILGLDKMKDALGCNDLSCAVQIGGALGVDLLLTGSVSTLGDEMIVSLTLIDTRESVAKKRAQARVADEERFYAHAIAAAVAQLYDLPAPAAPTSERASATTTRPLGRNHRETVTDAAPNAGGGISFETSLASVQVSVHSLTDGQRRSCAAPIATGQPCYLKDLPAGPATVDFELPDRKLTREIVVRGGDLERKLTVVDGRQGATPWVVGGVFVAGGAALLVSGLDQENEIGPTGEPTWGTKKMMMVIFGGASVASGLFTPVMIVATAEDYPVHDSAMPRRHTAAASAPTPAFSWLVAPLAHGALGVATMRF